jgi:hypothetical protein
MDNFQPFLVTLACSIFLYPQLDNYHEKTKVSFAN